MKKIAFVLLISMISSFGASARNAKPNKTKKVVVAGGCITYALMQGRKLVGSVMECTDNNGRTTRWITKY